MERLDKLLASQGLGTRSEVQRLIRGGGVTVDGAAGTGSGREMRSRPAGRNRRRPAARL